MTDPGPWWQEHQARNPTPPPGDDIGGQDRAVDAGVEWVDVGTLTTGPLARVDPAGLVGPIEGTWAVDWWVGAEDRWHFPSVEPAVRQQLVDDSPLVETRMRVPGGDLVHRVYGAQGSGVDGGGPVVVIEITNDTPTPVALSLAVRPHHPAGGGTVHQIDLDGSVIVVDGGPALVLESPPPKSVTGGPQRSVASRVVAGEAADQWEPVDDATGAGEVAVVLPLAHRATVVAALVAPPDSAGRLLDGWADRLPDPVRVASGWAQQAESGARLEVPDQSMAAVVAASRRALLLEAPALDNSAAATDQALVVAALAGLGHDDAVRPFVAGLVDRQRLSGWIDDGEGSQAATGAALIAMARWWSSARDDEMVAALVGPAAKASHRIDRRRGGRRHRKDARRAGLVPEGPQPLEIGGAGMTYHDSWWAAAGQIELARMLAAAGQPEAAEAARRSGRGLLAAVARSIDAVFAESGTHVIPSGPGRPLDESAIGLLPAIGPLGLLHEPDGPMARTLDSIAERMVDDQGAVVAGVRAPTRSARLTAQLAQAELRMARASALARIDWLTRSAGATRSWPRLMGADGHGAGGSGADPVAAATYLLTVRQLLVGERHDGGAGRTDLEVLAVLPPDWSGGAVEAHDLPTQAGRFGFAVRWHGDRPALLWELEGSGPVRITSPGLDPGWSTTEPVGEALLDPFAPSAIG